MKKTFLIILFVLMLPATSSFALPLTETDQRIFMPYATVGGGWWSGVVVHNTSGSTMNFSIGVYKDNGVFVSGSSFSVAAHAMKVDTLENFFGGTPPSLRMSPVITSHNTTVPFQATLFVGNDEGGFGFQNYTSSDYVHDIILIPLDPVP
ncbi:MAG: hypothetical protein ACYDAA_12795 [Syntrophales bacterium]